MTRKKRIVIPACLAEGMPLELAGIFLKPLQNSFLKHKGMTRKKRIVIPACLAEGMPLELAGIFLKPLQDYF